MPRIFGRLYHRLGASYFSTYVVFEFVSAFVVCLATVGIFSLYTETSAAEFWRVVAVAEGVVAIAVTYAVIREWTLSRPIIEWIRAGRPDDDALDVWRCAVGMPRQLVRQWLAGIRHRRAAGCRLADHADRAVSAARAIAEAIAERFGGEVRIGIGISTGPVVVGSVGGGGRLEFSVIGDVVNVAARV